MRRGGDASVIRNLDLEQASRIADKISEQNPYELPGAAAASMWPREVL